MEYTFKEVEALMLQYPRFRKEPGFKTMSALLKVIGYQDHIPIIHVAGTNGKGSVISMLKSILMESGVEVGVFTSPHLEDIRERMMIDNNMMDESTFVRLYCKLEGYVKSLTEEKFSRPTFFEWIFAMALMYFMEECPKVILVETGIGGRIDTTNVLNNKILTIITRIGFDHIDILGDNIKAIATEKAGIIREGVPTVFYNDNEEASRVIIDACYEIDSKLVKVLPYNDKILKRNEESIDFSGRNKYYNYEDLRLNTCVDYQNENSKVAVISASLLSEYFAIRPEDIKKGLKKFYWPGRMEYLSTNIIVDGAHNVDGIKAFVAHLNNHEADREVDVMFACMASKQYKEMIHELRDIKNLRHVYIPITSVFDKATASKLASGFNQVGYKSIIIVENLNNFILDRASNVGATTLLGCVGSLYLVGEIIKLKRRTWHD